MIMISSYMQSWNLSVFGFVYWRVELLYEITHQLEMTMFDSSKERRIPLFISNFIVQLDSFNEVANYLNASAGTCEMKRHLSFGLFGGIQQYLQWFVFW